MEPRTPGGWGTWKNKVFFGVPGGKVGGETTEVGEAAAEVVVADSLGREAIGNTKRKSLPWVP